MASALMYGIRSVPTDLIGPEIQACMVVTSDTGFMQSEVGI